MKVRHICIFCGKKRFQERMTSFTFVSYSTPLTKSRVKHWACSKNGGLYDKNCFQKLLEIDFTPVIMP